MEVGGVPFHKNSPLGFTLVRGGECLPTWAVCIETLTPLRDVRYGAVMQSTQEARPGRPGRPRSPDPRMFKKTAMVSPQELKLCDRYRKKKSTTKVCERTGKKRTVVPSRSDIVREGALGLIDAMHHRGVIYRPDERSPAKSPRSERVAGVFTAEEEDQIQSYCSTISWTFSNVLREGLLRLIT